MKKILLVVSLLISGAFADKLNVAIAANVSYAIGELKAEFNKIYPDIEIHETLTSSGKLTAQIKNGAPFDIFMSANMKFPDALYADGLAVTKPVVYAQGSLAYLSSKQLDYSKGIDLVTGSDIKKIAIANPKTAPYGKAAVEAMTNGKVYDKVKANLVFAESISQTVTYALTATDVGFIAKSTLYSDKMKEYKKGVNWEDVDPKLYTPINQGIVLLKKAENNPEAKAFYDFMLSEKAKKILLEYGYLVP
ncbi:molybdate ABC transporter substrate-binding protein [Halarcobacter ebronensis]|uniref:Molybdate ABC transporter substrate-binding protein n=1 Tax=Halarcobacter ebronensis TaxID=1462615 RepID=A0A4Q1APY8_9BACT|nr:molybdate ABC transporter substrate-binding protein [Halarcobacter ebronensis]RXK08699.1 molybdate ABC transporter substrate-binding protein [Halarcobacter ebronensis]